MFSLFYIITILSELFGITVIVTVLFTVNRLYVQEFVRCFASKFTQVIFIQLLNGWVFVRLSSR